MTKPDGSGETKPQTTQPSELKESEPDLRGAVHFGDGVGRVVLENAENVLAGEFTVEAWVKIDGFTVETTQYVLLAEEVGVVDALGNEIRPRFAFGLAYGWLGCHISSADTAVVSGADVEMRDYYMNRWIHLACVRGDNAIGLWIDGVLQSFSPSPHEYTHGALPLYLGGSALDDPYAPYRSFQGSLAALRISQGRVYQLEVEQLLDAETLGVDDETFDPPEVLEERSDTVLLWHFDECVEQTTTALGSATSRQARLEGNVTWTACEFRE